MPQESGADLLSLLLGPTPEQYDPRAGAMMRLMEAGQLPGNQVSNVNTILDLLSPSATRDYVEQTQPFIPDQLGQTAGVGPGEAYQFARQALGLQTSPSEELAYQANVAEALPDLINAQTRQGELGVAQKELGIKQQDADTRKAQVELEQAQAERWAQGTPDEQYQMLQTSIGMMAMYGIGPNGDPVPPDVKRKAEQLWLKQRANPELTAVLTQLIRNGDEASLTTFANLSGLPVEVYDPWFGGPVLRYSDGASMEDNALAYTTQAIEEGLAAYEAAQEVE